MEIKDNERLVVMMQMLLYYIQLVMMLKIQTGVHIDFLSNGFKK